MNLFLERLKKSVTETTIVTIYILVNLVIVSGIILIVFILPMYFLELFIGEYAHWWFVITMLTLVGLAMKDSVKLWIQWQLIEPFKNKKE